MFEQAFSWLESPRSTLNFSNQNVTLLLCLTTKKNASEQLQEARRAYAAHRYTEPQDPQALRHSHSELLRIERYLKFIETCEVHLQQENTQSIYLLLLNNILSSTTTQMHAHTVLAAWLIDAPTLALQFYEKYLAASLQAPGSESQNDDVVINMGTVCARYFLDNLKASIQHQINPLGLCQLSLAFIDTPLRFLACIIWIIEQGGEIDALIRSGILHQYISYHFPSFGVFDRPLNIVSLIYKIIAQFESAKVLIDQAVNFSCDVRGFKRINLLGQPGNGLLSIDKAEPLSLLTRTPDNLQQIINFFGAYGLIQSIDELFHCSDDDFDRFFIHLVQESGNLLTPLLMKQTAEEKSGNLHKLAHFMDDALFQQWISEEKFSILFLLPYKPQWVPFINNTMMVSFLQSFDSTHSPGSELESAKLLLSMYMATVSVNAALAEPVFQALFQLILTYRYLLDDRLLFITLKQSQYLNPLVAIEEKALTDDLVKNIQNFINDGVTSSDYDSLITHWRLLLETFEILALLKKVHSPFPVTMPNFIVFVFQQYAMNPVHSWPVLLEVTHLVLDPESKISAYERDLFLTLLARIDNAELREIIITTLHLTDDFFLDKGRQVLLNGIACKNIGLLNLYLSNNPLDDELLKQAIVFQQWPMISLWLKEHGFSDNAQEIIDFLLVEVSGSKNIKLLRALIKDSDLHFSVKTVAAAFSKASGADDPIALNYLYLLRPSPMTLKAVVTQVIKDNHYKALSFFKRFKKRNEHLANGVLQAFNSAVKNNDINMVSCLMEFSANAPTQAMVKTAKNGVEEREITNVRRMKNTKNKINETGGLGSCTTTEMFQLLSQHLSSTPSVQQKQAQETLSKFPPTKSFFSTDSLVAVSSSVFASPIGSARLQRNDWSNEEPPIQTSSLLAPTALTLDRDVMRRNVSFQ